MTGGPVLEHRPAFVDEKTRALQKLFATVERDLGEDFGDRRRRDRRVVLYLERGRDALARRDDPSDAKTREAVDLREPTGHDDPPAPAAERRTFLRRSLGPAIDLIREDPRAVLIRDPHDALDLGLREDLPGRVVRLADADDLGARVDGSRERVEVDRPRALFTQPHLTDPRAERRRDAVDLHVVRHDDDDFVARVDERRESEEVRLA